MDRTLVRNLSYIFYHDKKKYLQRTEPLIKIAAEGMSYDGYHPIDWQSADPDIHFETQLRVLSADMYYFADCVSTMNSAVYHIPQILLYSRLKLITQMYNNSCDLQLFYAFDLHFPFSKKERQSLLRQIILSDALMFNDSITMTFASSTENVLACELGVSNKFSHTEQDFSCVEEEVHIHFGLQKWYVHTLTSEHVRETILRHKASECSSLPMSSVFMLTDPNFPLSCIPGVTTRDELISLSYQSDREKDEISRQQ